MKNIIVALIANLMFATTFGTAVKPKSKTKEVPSLEKLTIEKITNEIIEASDMLNALINIDWDKLSDISKDAILKANIYYPTFEDTLLTYAISKNCLPCVELLINLGSDTNLYSPLNKFIEQVPETSESIRILHHLIKRGAQLTSKPNRATLKTLIEKPDFLQILLDNKIVAVDTASNTGSTISDLAVNMEKNIYVYPSAAMQQKVERSVEILQKFRDKRKI